MYFEDNRRNRRVELICECREVRSNRDNSDQRDSNDNRNQQDSNDNRNRDVELRCNCRECNRRNSNR